MTWKDKNGFAKTKLKVVIAFTAVNGKRYKDMPKYSKMHGLV